VGTDVGTAEGDDVGATVARAFMSFLALTSRAKVRTAVKLKTLMMMMIAS
jgi:hypothetical protein